MTILGTKFKPLEIRADAPEISSDGGLLALKRANESSGFLARMASCLRDPRRGDRVHSLEKMLTQRVYAVVMGWEDCNDFKDLSRDPLYNLVLGSTPASQPTLSRFENWADARSVCRLGRALRKTFVLRRKDVAPKRIVLDIDLTDDRTHGQQEFDFFNPFYGGHCYAPILLFGSCDGGSMELLASELRPGCVPTGSRVAASLRRVALDLRRAFPKTEILVRADAGFCAPEFFEVCERFGLMYFVAMGKNSALDSRAEKWMAQARAERDATKAPARFFSEFEYAARRWRGKPRKVVVKAEATMDKDNPRYVVTNVEGDPQALYEQYCGRGECENRIKEMKLDLHSGRTSCHRFWANALRLMIHSMAYTLVSLVREHLVETEFAKSTVGQIRVKLLKMAAIVEVSTRRISVRLPKGHPYADLLIAIAKT